jgi:NitT/TauT family transport system permease protein
MIPEGLGTETSAADTRRERWAATAALLVVIAALGMLGRTLDVPSYVVPSPSELISGMVEWRSELVANAVPTMIEASLGFLIGNAAAVVVAIAAIHNRLVMKVLLAVCLGLRSVPVVALAPVLTLWLGLYLAPKVAIVVLLVFFPTLIVVMHGLTSVPREVIDLFTTLDGTRLQILFKARFPHAVPHLFNALKIAAPTAVSGALVAEWLQSDEGLGHLMAVATYQFQITLLWAAILAASLLGALSYCLIVALERASRRWAR